jgi:hypothetical protein
MGLEPSDVSAVLKTFEATDASGFDQNLDRLGTLPVRIALTPGAELMSISNDNSVDEVLRTPSWPDHYQADVKFGNLVLKQQRDESGVIDFRPMVDHFSALACKNGICSSEDSFALPVSGTMELIQLGSSRRKVIDSWYFGAIAPAQYQGLLKSIPHMLEPGTLSVGKRYAIEFIMRNPNDDYEIFKTKEPQMNFDLGISGGIGGIGTLSTLPRFGVAPIMKKVPTFPGFGSDTGAALTQSLRELEDGQIEANWPPRFSQVCSRDSHACLGVRQLKFLKKLGVEFTLGEIRQCGGRSL